MVSDRIGQSMIQLTDPDRTLTVDIDPIGARIAAIVDATTGHNILFAADWSNEDYSGQFPDADSNVEWHRRYPGGWHVMIPHVGDSVTIDGVTHPFHGEAAWRAWRVTETGPASCALRVVLRTAPLEVTRRVTVSPSRVDVTQSVRNYSGEPTRFSWTEHPALGDAVIDVGTTVRVGGEPVALRIPAPSDRFSGMTTAACAGLGSFDVTNPANGLVVSAEWDSDVFPVVSIWQEHRDSGGSPWWNMVNALAPEPSSREYQLEGESLGPLALNAGDTLTTTLSMMVGHVPTSHPPTP